jgi:hypothetical protein
MRSRQGIEDLWRKVNGEFEKHGCRVVAMAEDLRERCLRIRCEPLECARAGGWNPGLVHEDWRPAGDHEQREAGAWT